MAERRCRQRRPVQATDITQPETVPMEATEISMNRYISPHTLTGCAPSSCDNLCQAQGNRVLLEQLVELSVTQNQLLVDLLGAVNALTAAILTARAQV